MYEKTHYFIAVRLPDPIKSALNEAKEHLQKYFTFQRWVHPEDYHITLAFLGSAGENQLVDVKKLVQDFIQNEKAFSLTISHIGIFGMKTSPRIFWAGVNESNQLENLRDKVYHACEQAGFQLEKRTFHPHITLARKWHSEDSFHQGDLELYNIFNDKSLSFHATEVVLYKTNPLRTPKYENLITFSLQV